MRVRKSATAAEVKANPRKYGDKREGEIAKRGYKHTPGSGSGNLKGDLRRANWMVEVKATTADSFRVTADIMGKLRNDGLTNGRPGVLIVELGNGRKFAIMPLSQFEKLVPPE